MRFLKNLFGNRDSNDEPFVPTPTQTIPGLEPIVVYAVEQLYPGIEEQKHAFTYLLKHTQENDTSVQLSILRWGIEHLENLMEKNPSVTVRYAVYSEGGMFPTMKAAKRWVKSITNLSP
ncbi:MAG TPA: hypothetical protein VK897_01535 [Anaerolineales bacterium]|nr:hypothetical protein [Anaerolineales bacterium]